MAPIFLEILFLDQNIWHHYAHTLVVEKQYLGLMETQMSMPEETYNGIFDIIFKSSDYYGVMAEEFRYMMIVKFV